MASAVVCALQSAAEGLREVSVSYRLLLHLLLQREDLIPCTKCVILHDICQEGVRTNMLPSGGRSERSI